MGRDKHLWLEVEGEERFLYSKKPPHGGKISWDKEETSK